MAGLYLSMVGCNRLVPEKLFETERIRRCAKLHRPNRQVCRQKLASCDTTSTRIVSWRDLVLAADAMKAGSASTTTLLIQRPPSHGRKPEATGRQRRWSQLCSKSQTSTDCRIEQDSGGSLMGSIVANASPWAHGTKYVTKSKVPDETQYSVHCPCQVVMDLRPGVIKGTNNRSLSRLLSSKQEAQLSQRGRARLRVCLQSASTYLQRIFL